MVNLQLAQTHLRALGYAPADKIHFRAIGPQTQKLEGTLDQQSERLKALNVRGHGIYIVVNGDGHTDADVTAGRAVFYEHDDLPKEVQIDLWKTLGLPQPTIQIDTGGKSIHSYWVFDHPIEITRWRVLQADLLDFADADRSIKNPSRVMRLAGFTHQKSGGESVVVSNPGKRYSFEYLRSMVTVVEPTSEPAPKSSPKPSQAPYLGMDEIPLIRCIAPKHRDLIASGMSEGGRDNTGIAIAMDLIGTEQYLRSIGQRFDGNARSLHEDYCSRCNPPLTGNDVERIWKSAEKSTNGPCLSEDKIQGCIDAHLKRGQSKGDRPVASAGHEPKPLTVLDGGKNVPNAPTEGLRAAVLQAIGESLQGSAKTERIGELATHYRQAPTHVNRLWKEILEEQEQADDSEDEAEKRLESELSITSQSLPFEVLPYQIAMHLPRQAELIGTTTEALVITAFPVLASVINAGTGLRVKAGANPWFVWGIIWIALVAMSGDGKTPTIGVWMNALKSLQKTESENYEESATEFKRAKRAWDTAVRKGEEPDSKEPESPVLRWTVVKQATLQGLAETQMGQPNHGCLIYKPELTALQNSFGMHSQAGASDDLEQFLDLRDGGEILTRNAGRIRRTESTRFSLMGGIQPSKLLEQMGDRKDSQGFWGRFCIYNLPTVDPDDNETDLDISDGRQLSDLLSAVVLRINSFPPCIHELSSEAKERSKVYRKELQNRVHAESREQMRNFTKKLKGYVHEFALVLHLLDAAVESGVEPAKDVSLETLERAIAVSEFCHAQRHVFEAQADAAVAKTQTKTTITTIQAEILKRARSTKQAVTARECKNFIHICSGVDVESLRTCFVSLEKAGYGKTIGSGNRLKFEASQLTTGKEDESMTYEYTYESEEEMLATA